MAHALQQNGDYPRLSWAGIGVLGAVGTFSAVTILREISIDKVTTTLKVVAVVGGSIATLASLAKLGLDIDNKLFGSGRHIEGPGFAFPVLLVGTSIAAYKIYSCFV